MVLLIIGFGIGMVAVNVGVSDTDARSEAKQFANLTAMVADEAVLNHQPWGVDLFRGIDDSDQANEVFGYRWLQRVYWQPPADSEEKPRWLWLPVAPPGIAAELYLSPQLALRLDMENIEKTIEPKVQRQQKPELQKEVIRPDIYFWGNGEITPFKLTLYTEQGEQQLHTISGDLLGRIALDLPDDE